MSELQRMIGEKLSRGYQRKSDRYKQLIVFLDRMAKQQGVQVSNESVYH